MRTPQEVRDNMFDVENEINHWKDRLDDLEGELIEAEDAEAAERECKTCDGTGMVDPPDGAEEPEDWDYTCPACDGTGEKQC